MRKNKIRGNLFVWVALFVFMLGCNSERVFAAETNQNGVIVETTFDKSSYQNEEKIIYSVYIQNTNSEIINIKDINFDIPDGYKLNEKTTNESMQNIQPGAHILLKYYIDKKTTNDGSGKDDSNTKDNPSNGDNKDNSSKENNIKSDNTSKENNNGDLVSNNNKGANTSETKQVGTGDNAKILLWITIMIVALIIIFMIIFHTKNRKGLLSLLLIMATLTEIIISPISVKAEENPSMITLTDKFVVKDVEKNINIHINYEKQSVNLEEDTTTYTRGEWIQEIVNTYGINVDLEEASETKFTDIENSQYRDSIRIAEIYGIVDSGEFFFPDKAVTREFAAVTVVRLLGYQGTGIPVCKDLDNINNKEEVYLALKAGAFLLEDGYFNPMDLLNKKDYEQALQHIKEVLKSTEIDVSRNTGYVYKENVIQLDSISLEDEKHILVEKNDKTKNIKKNDIIVVGEKKAYKVISLKDLGNAFEIEFSTPELNEFLDSMSICGEQSTIDWNNIELADGVSMKLLTKNDEIATYSDSDNIAEQEMVVEKPVGAAFTVQLGEKDKGAKLELSLDKITVKYDAQVDYTALRIYNAYAVVEANPSVTITPNVKKKGDNETTNSGDNETNPENNVDESSDSNNNQLSKLEKFAQNFNNDYYGKIEGDSGVFEKKEIGTIPIPNTPLNLKFYFAPTLEGTFCIQCDISLAGGAQVINNMPRIIHNVGADISIAGELKASLSICGALEFDALGVDFLGAGITPKFVLNANATAHISQPILCGNMRGYLGLEVGILKECKIAEWLNLDISYDVFDEDNTPKKFFNKHIEVGNEGVKFPKACSHDENEHIINVYVDDKETRQPLSDTKISIENASYRTDDKGYANNIVVIGNEITILTEKEGYISKEIKIDSSKCDKNYVIEIILSKIPDEENTTEYNMHYYKVFTGNFTWNEAKKACEEKGGHLVTITSKEEQEFINALNALNQRVWIGGTRKNAYNWTWVTGEPWMYENWADGEPNNSPDLFPYENCVTIWNDSGQWNDLNSENLEQQDGFICEWE